MVHKKNQWLFKTKSDKYFIKETGIFGIIITQYSGGLDTHYYKCITGNKNTKHNSPPKILYYSQNHPT